MTDSSAADKAAPRPRARRDLRERMETAVISDIEIVGPHQLGLFRIARPDGRPFREFKPGQYAQLGLWSQPAADPRPRQYSIASSPYELNELEFYIYLVESGGALGEDTPGVLTSALWGNRVGDELLFMERPAGHFVLDRTTSPNIVAVSNGTGLAPFVSMVRKMREDLRRGEPMERTLTIIHGVSYTSDLGYRAYLEECAAVPGLNLTYIPAISRPHQSPAWDDRLSVGRANDLIRLILGETGDSRIAPRLEPSLLELMQSRLVPEFAAVYLCGHPGMIEDCSAALAGKGFVTEGRETQVITEDYW